MSINVVTIRVHNELFQSCSKSILSVWTFSPSIKLDFLLVLNVYDLKMNEQ